MLSAPDGFRSLLDPLPAGVDVDVDPQGEGPYDVIIAFVRSVDELEQRFGRGRQLLDLYGGLWIGWPKQASPLATDMKEADVRGHGLSTGLVDNKICAIDPDWSGLRFVVRMADRPPRTR